MAPELVLVIITEFLISKVISSYVQPYSSSPYLVQDLRSQSSYTPDYQSYYASYASKVAQPTYQTPVEVLTPTPIEYRQSSYPSYPNKAEFLSPAVQRPMEFRPPTYPALTTPNKQSPMEYRSPIYQKATEFVSPALQAQRPLEYRARAYQKPMEYVTPTIEYQQPFYQQPTESVTPKFQPLEFPVTYQKAVEYVTPTFPTVVEYLSPTYQNNAELTSATIHTPLEYNQPTYQKVAEFITNREPTEIQQPICHTSSDPTTKLQSSQPPTLTSALDYLQELTLSKPDHLPHKSSSGALDTDVLNNLAIALQLLIFNNIINHPRSESLGSLTNMSDSIRELANAAQSSAFDPFNVPPPCEMHSAKFLASSNFGDDIMSKGMLGLGSFGLPAPRPGFNLMSPYEAIASSPSPSSPFSESASLYTLKSNFQSPYAAIMASDNSKDLFSIY